jgi:hypothetical protein
MSTKVLLTEFGKQLDRMVWAIGLMTILNFVSGRWPDALEVAFGVGLVVFLAWYFWEYCWKHFRNPSAGGQRPDRVSPG